MVHVQEENVILRSEAQELGAYQWSTTKIKRPLGFFAEHTRKCLLALTFWPIAKIGVGQ